MKQHTSASFRMSEYAEQNPRAAEDTPKLTLPESKKTNNFLQSLNFEPES
jgi:hypothetical protein